MIQAISPASIAASLSEYWSPRIIGEVDDAYVKVAKLKGSLIWHQHESEDEMFFVLKGRLRIETESETVELGEGGMYVVAKGVRHNPIAEEECLVMVIEKKSTLHTGDVVVAQTRTLEEQAHQI